MNRSRDSLPLEASRAVEDLIYAWERRVRTRQGTIASLGYTIEAHRQKSSLYAQGYTSRWSSLASTTSFVGNPEGRVKADRRTDKARAALRREYEAACAERAAKLSELERERDSLEVELPKDRDRVYALNAAGRSSEGLAPWDILAIRATRALSGDSDAPVTISTDERTEMMKGSEAEDLVRERLGISRSTYYERFRPLLKRYPMNPMMFFRLADGQFGSSRSATFRFRRDEVEALLDFLTAQAC